MSRTRTAFGLVMAAAGLVAPGCQTAGSGQHDGTKPHARGQFLSTLKATNTDNGYSPMFPIQVSGVMIQASDARVFWAQGTGKEHPDRDRVDFGTIVMPHPTLSDIPSESSGPRTVRFTPYNSMPSLRLQYGIIYMSGRWRVPATLRVKGGRDTIMAGGSTLAASDEPEGTNQYQGLLLVWVSGDDECWFWQPDSPNTSLPINLLNTTPAAGQIPANSYVRVKNIGGMGTIVETVPFARTDMRPHSPKVVEVFEAAMSAAKASGLPWMTELTTNLPH